MSTVNENSLLGQQDELNKPTGANTPDGRIANYSTGTPTTQNGSGRFQNLQKYVDANKGAGVSQASRLGNATDKDIKSFNDQNQANTQDINDKAGAAKTLFEQNGTQYANNLNQWQQGMNTMNSVADRGQFDQAAQAANQFTQGDQFGTFQNLQNGAGYDQAAAQNTLQSGALQGQNTLGSLQNKAGQIQTEAGRYSLLQQAASPYGPRTTMGGNRLNQLLFQADPNAVKALQNQFTTQGADVQNKLNAFQGLEGSVINPLVQQEADLQNTLNTGASGLQSTFENKLGNQANYDVVNNSRKALYDAYVKQLQTGNISSNLGDILGVNDYQNVYNPYAQTATNTSGSPLQGFTGGKMAVTPQQQMANAMPNQLRTYNALSDPNSVSSWLNKNGAEANKLQDVLSTNDYSNYQGLHALNQNNPTQGMKASGASNLGAVATAVKNPTTGNSSLLDSIMAQDQNFANTYGGKTVESKGWAAQGGPGNTGGGGAGSNTNAVGAAGLVDNKTNSWDYWNTLKSQLGGTAGSGQAAVADSSVNAAVLNPASTARLGAMGDNGKIFDNGGDATASRKAAAVANGTSLNNVNTMMNNIMSTTGVRNTTNLNQAENLTETQQLLRSLGLM